MISSQFVMPTGIIHTQFIGADSEFAATDVSARYAKILAAHPQLRSLAFTEQVHGDATLAAQNIAPGAQLIGEGDALVTREKNVALLIRTADCIPILFFSASEPVIGAVHAGWRGLKKNILTRCIAGSGVSAKNLQFVVGPSISGQSYEVGEEVAREFAPEHSYDTAGGKFMLDLKSVLNAEFAALGVGVANVAWHDADTLKTSAWYSARRGNSARNFALVWRE